MSFQRLKIKRAGTIDETRGDFYERDLQLRDWFEGRKEERRTNKKIA